VYTILGKLIDCPFVTAALKADYQKTLAANPCGSLK
jgi:hypothetical protein